MTCFNGGTGLLLSVRPPEQVLHELPQDSESIHQYWCDLILYQAMIETHIMAHNDNHFVYQLEPQQSILKALISKMKSDIASENKHEYESKNENEKMPQKTQERLDQTSRCKSNWMMKHSFMSRVKAVLDVYSEVMKKKDKDN